MDGLMLRCAVGGEEGAAQVHDGVTLPGHAHDLLFGDSGDNGGFEVFLARIAEELVHVIGGHVNSHAFLGFGNRQFGAVQAFVLLGHQIKVDGQAVGDLAGCHGHAARAEIVAALDQTAGVLAAEQTLELAFDGGVALLHFCAVFFKAFLIVRLRGAGCAADAVTAGTPAQQDDLVAGGRGFTADMVGRGCTHDGADFHALGHIARMVDLVDLTGRQTDLIAVRGVSGGRGGDNLALGELALERFGNRDTRVAGAGHAHRLIHVGTARQRVADAPADAGGRAAERFDFGRVVVGFVLEQEQPVLVLAVHIDLHFDGAGVDFLGFVQVLENAVLLKPLGTDRAHIHEAYRLAVAPELMAHGQILVERGLDHGVIDIDFVKLRAEGGVTAVIGPVGVDHLDLGDGRFAVFTVEILLAYFRIRQIHRETALVDEPLEAFVVQLVESGDDLDLRRLGDLHFECVLRFQGGFAGFDRVDHILFDLLDGLIVQVAFKRVDFGAAYNRAFALADQLDAFARRIGALIELSG